MLEPATKAKTYSVLKADLVVSGTTAVDTGLQVSVVANVTYRMEYMINTTGSADGIQLGLVGTGTPAASGLVYELYDPTTTVYAAGIANINDVISSGSDIMRCSGVFVSNYTGILKITARETIDFGSDSVIKAGSYLLVQPL